MRYSHIEILGEKHPLCLNHYALKAIGREFGTATDISDLVDANNIYASIDNVDKMLEILMEGGRQFCKAAHIECPPPIENIDAVLDATDVEEYKRVMTAIQDVIKQDTSREVEVAEKN